MSKYKTFSVFDAVLKCGEFPVSYVDYDHPILTVMLESLVKKHSVHYKQLKSPSLKTRT